jgi:hypothetical protein
MAHHPTHPMIAAHRERLLHLPPEVREKLATAYAAVDRGRYVYARGGFPRPKTPSTEGDQRRIEAAHLKRQRKADLRCRNGCRAAIGIEEGMRFVAYCTQLRLRGFLR